MIGIKDVAKISGVSVRTLHYYDEIGVLTPSKRTDAGYRLYSNDDIEKLKTILMYRELEFSLSDIRDIVFCPDFDRNKAVLQQIELLKLKKKHIEELITLAQNILTKGDNTMNFYPLNNPEAEKYRAEAKEKWGNTPQYKEYEKNNPDTDKASGLMTIFCEAGKLKALPPESTEVQEKIKALQEYISENFYTCTKEILLSLGEMYTGDERFKQNIDSAGGDGTAEFVNRAVKIYCKIAD